MKTITIPETEYLEIKSTIQKLEVQYQKLLNKVGVRRGEWGNLCRVWMIF